MLSDYDELTEVIEQQARTISRQTKVIKRLLRDNAEKENLINALIAEGEDD